MVGSQRNMVRYNRPVNFAMRKAAALLLITGILLSACSSSLWGHYDPYLTPSTFTAVLTDTPSSTPTATPTPLQGSTSLPAASFTPSPTFTLTPTLPGPTDTPSPERLYRSQSGDSLPVVAIHFGVQPSEIASSVSLPANGYLSVDTVLVIPDTLSQTPTTPSTQIIPDSEVVYSPTAVDFNIENYINQAGGKLSTYSEYVAITGESDGGQVVQRLAFECSINPRLLLALIQDYSGWVEGQPKPGVDDTYPLGYHVPLYNGLYHQMFLLARDLAAGYYGWRSGKLSELTFPDGTTLRLAPDLNAGTVALQYLFSTRYNYADWLQKIDSQTGFMALYLNMFGDPWERDQSVAPLIPSSLPNPNFSLPFEPGVPWNFTNGPHPAWESESSLAALDFAPPVSNCDPSDAWAVAIAPGLIVRSGGGYVVLDVDHDGYEQTGWAVLYMHIADEGRIADNTYVNAGDHIGHPSCLGGLATGTHLHIARKYNGEWIGAGEPFPFVMSGWTAHYGASHDTTFYEGTLTKGDQAIVASKVGAAASRIIRQPGE